MTSEILSRHDLSRRWAVSLRTIDRLRGAGKLAWVDIAAGRGARPLVRFALNDVLEFEARQREGVSANAD